MDNDYIKEKVKVVFVYESYHESLTLISFMFTLQLAIQECQSHVYLCC